MGWLDVFKRQAVERDAPLAFDQWVDMFGYLGSQYPIVPMQTLKGERMEAPGDFVGYAAQLYKSNGPVFACMAVRHLLFSEARFMFRERIEGRPGKLYGNSTLGILNVPWTGGTTGDLLARMIQDADLQGDAFVARRPRRLKRLRPDWVTVIYGSQGEGMWNIDSELLGYLYHPGGVHSEEDPVPLLPESVAHFMPNPDPLSPGRGMSWLTPVLREILGDQAATVHKTRFFENAGTPNMAVTFPDSVKPEAFERWVDIFEGKHTGVANAYKTLYLGGAAKPEIVGLDFKQMDFKVTQGAGETRIAAAAGVPPVIAGFSEGLQSATYSNYSQARRRFADATLRPLWRNCAGSLARIIPVPWGSELWYDDSDIAFLREDQKDEAEVQSLQAQAIKALIDAGFEADAAVTAVTSGDLMRLEKAHSGLFSVQLQPAGQKALTGTQLPELLPSDDDEGGTNG